VALKGKRKRARSERPPRSLVRFSELRKVFHSDREPLRAYDVYLARLSVLYEDLRIEITAIAARSIPKLDILDPIQDNSENKSGIGAYRRHYFLRRAVATLREFGDCLKQLKKCPEFRQQDSTATEALSAAIEFFAKNMPQIQRVRNDVGGHFGQEAAQYAVKHLVSGSSGKIEFVRDGQGNPRDPRLHFAGEIAATALGRAFPGQTLSVASEIFIRDVLLEAFRQAARCVQVLIVMDLAHRFGR
jgi:hypothetical protein